MTFRQYEASDFIAVRDFLVHSHSRFPLPSLWFLDRWNFVSEVGRHFHGLSRQDWASHIGLWVDGSGAIGAMAHEEEGTGAVFFQFAEPSLVTRGLLAEMFDWAEATLCVDGGLDLRCTQPLMTEMADERGYVDAGWSEPLCSRSLDTLRPPLLPEAYRFAMTGEASPSMRATAHARAFGYAGKTGFEMAALEAFAQLNGMPDWKPELDVCILGPTGDVVAFACAWLDRHNGLCVLEPVGTVAEHRRRGLGHAAVEMALYRAREAGARTGWVGSDQDFYLSTGFRVVTRHPVRTYRKDGLSAT